MPNNWWAWLFLYAAPASLSMRTWAPCMKMAFYFEASLRMWRESLVMMSKAMVNLLKLGPARCKMDWIYIHTEVRYWSRAELSSLTKNLWSGSFWFWLVWLVLINFLGLIGLDFGRKLQIWRLLGTMAEFLGFCNVLHMCTYRLYWLHSCLHIKLHACDSCTHCLYTYS